MNSRVRRAALCPLLLATLAVGPTAFAQAPSAVKTGTCTVKPSDDGSTVTVTGTDFIGTGGAALHGTVGVPVGLGNLDGLTPPGFFSVGNLPPADYHVKSQKQPDVNCTTVASDKDTKSKSVREAQVQGFKDGVKAGRAAAQEDCDNDKPKPHKKPGVTAPDPAVEAAYDKAFVAGATSAFNKLCRTGH